MFEKNNATRDVLYSLARFCTLSPQKLGKLFEQEAVYPQRQEWTLFLERLLLALGAILGVSGVLFFFAYNWADMHKFVKLGLLQGLLLVMVSGVLFAPINRKFREVLLNDSAILLGILFAVYGQIYQTGANAYDFFQGWTMGVLLWAVAGRSTYLWLIFLLLVNLTLHFYAEQVRIFDWPDFLLPTLLVLINAAAVTVWELLWQKGKIKTATRWFPVLVGLAAMIINTMSVCDGIFGEFRSDLAITLLLTCLLYSVGLTYGNRQHLLFYPAAIGLSLIVIGTCMLIQLIEPTGDEGALLLSSLFVIGTTTALVFYLKNLSKLWYGNR